MDSNPTVEIANRDYEEDYIIDDPAFFEPFVVYKAVGQGLPAWWQNRGKVEALIQALKMDFTAHECSIYAGISIDQYKYFCRIHPHFSVIRARCKGVLAIAAKKGLVGDIAHPSGFRSRQWYLERKQPRLYGRAPELPMPPPGTAAITTITHSAFADKDGNVLMSQKTAEIIRKIQAQVYEQPQEAEAEVASEVLPVHAEQGGEQEVQPEAPSEAGGAELQGTAQ